MKLIKFITIIIVITIINIISTRSARAQSIDLGVWPPILQVVIQPGKSITQVYKVTSFGDPAIISSSVTPFVPEDEEGNVKLIDCKTVEVIGCESLNWFSLQNANLELGQAFFLGSDRTQEAVVKIAVPDYASEGDYYNTLLFTTQAAPGLGQKNSRAKVTIGSNILITISKDGNPTRDIKIVEFSTKNFFQLLTSHFSLPVHDSFEPIPVTLRVQNTGNAYTSVSGKITLSGFPGLKSNFSLVSQNILAGSTRLLSATPSAELNNPSSNFSLQSPTSNVPSPTSLILPRGFYLGRYTLEAEVENENGMTKLVKISFYALPLKIIFWIVLIILISSVIFKFKKKLRPK